jgi:LacI family transcriptional regulator
VSIATVSRVFNQSISVSDVTRKRVLKVAEAVGYHPQVYAQGLASQKSNTIMAVVPVISNYFFMEILGGIQDKLADQTYELTIFNVTAGDQLFEDIEHILKRKWAEGYLFISIHLNHNQWEKLKRFDVPITLIDEHHEGFDSVSVDNVQGAYRATKSLIEKGFRRIAILSALQTSKPMRDRLIGYQKALEDNGIKFDPSYVIVGTSLYRDGFTEKHGYEAMCKMLAMDNPPEACFSASDIQAIGALKAMKDMDSYIPIIGYDDIELAEYIGLSTIRQPMKDMAFVATENIVERLKNKEKSFSQTIYSPELILRTSTN